MEEITNQKAPMDSKAERIAEFIMATQRSFLLDLAKDLNDWNVSYAQFFLLGYLSGEINLTMTDIANKMGHSTAAATGLVDRLEKLGYLSRGHADNDRRKVLVTITENGRELVKSIRSSIADNVQRSLERDSAPQNQAAIEALELIH